MDVNNPHWSRIPREDGLAAFVKSSLHRVFESYTGNLAVRLWNGDRLALGQGTPSVTVVFDDPYVVRSLILSTDPLRLAEAYFRGAVHVEGDFDALLAQSAHFSSLKVPRAERFRMLRALLLAPKAAQDREPARPRGARTARARFLPRHTRRAAREAIAFHYDVSNAFYETFLDEQLVYSCAYFEALGDTLDEAQCNKLDHICRKLRMKPGERLLDLGCGWGALLRWAARHYGVSAHGITLSEQQYAYARQRARDEGLEHLVTVELRDYRDMQGQAVFDKIVSVGMFEHVGLKNLPLYFATARRLLKPEGLFLNHGITHDAEGWKRTLSTEFINRYVFPDGELDTISNVQREIERAGFEIIDVESLRRHYALTLRHWVRRLDANRDEALRHVRESTFRVWRLYMSACALAFEDGGTAVYQVLVSPRGSRLSGLPLTRRDLYE